MLRRHHVISGAVSGLALGCLAGCTDIRERRDDTSETPLVLPPASGMQGSGSLAALEAESRRLFVIASSGNGDAEAEAKRSMDRGDFRFVGYSYLTPGVFPAAYGVQCQPSVFSQPDLVGPLFARSDVLDELEQQNIREANFRRFGSAYNAIILADARFPFRHQCSAVPVGDARERSPEHRDAGRQ